MIAYQRYTWFQVIVNSSSPGQNGRHFVDYPLRCIFVNGEFCILFKISLKFIPNSPIDSIGLDSGVVPNRRQAFIWTNAVSTHWHMYAAPEGNEF